MKKCAIITSYMIGNLELLLKEADADFVICADGGYNHAAKAGVVPDLVIGDMDSITVPIPPEIEVMTVPVEKDDTDTGLCIKTAIARGYECIGIIGGIGGRFDHAISNLQSMAAAASQGAKIFMMDGHHRCFVLHNDELKIKKREGQHVSLLSLSDVCQGVSASGLQYPLSNASLSNTFPLGVSNAYAADEATIRVKDGILMVILSTAA